MNRRDVLLFDGACPFCRAQVDRLLRRLPPDAIETMSLSDPAVGEHFPNLARETLLEAMHLVRSDGRVFRGAEAAVRVLASHPVLGRLALVYYLPGIRRLMDAVYLAIARRRYRISHPPAGACGTYEGGGPSESRLSNR